MKQIKTTNMRENITIEQIIENINSGKTLLKGVLLTYKDEECLVSVKNYVEPSIFNKTDGFWFRFLKCIVFDIPNQLYFEEKPKNHYGDGTCYYNGIFNCIGCGGCND